ncbi:nuclear envelope pore membrane protein POM 121-like [Perognathus longimembris pacificus]|uniref:nuclear envelope pore membrane protein POM 121-like n=1 Tax=Perognathus longimembris pacificus TaxID=214514 RepID=UPI002019E38F|nr:nuclear envelope pore membrane protein POM 121-like [Perognathus longimembris pacificus]
MFPAHLRRASRRSPPVERGAFHKRFHITPRRCYPIHQAKYPIGALPRVCWDEGYQKVVKRRMVCNPMTVRIPPPNRKRLRNFFLSSPASNGPDPCAKELAADANVERKKRTVEEEEQIFLDGQKTKRRRNDSSGGGHLAGDSLMTIRAPASHTTKPEARKRSLTSESSDDSVSNSKISTHIAGILSFGDRNAISSSYSSTLGTSISQLCKRNSSPSSRPQVLERPAKKAREEELCQPSSSSAPDTVSEDKVTDKLSQGKKAPDTDTKKQPNSGTLLSITGRSGTRKRKTQLLRPRRGVPLTLPPAPQVGYTVTAEDLDQEKRERLQRINEALEDKDKDKAVSSSVMEKPPTTQPSLTSTVPDTGPTFSSASLPDPDARLLLESWKNMQNCRHTQVFPKQAGTTTSALVPTKTPNLSHGPIGTSLPGLQRNNSSDALLGPAPTFSRTQVFDIKTPAAPQAETPAIAQGLPAPLPTTDPGMLFVVPCHLPSNPSCSAAPDVSSAYYTFQILFLSPNRSDSGSACVPSPSSTMALASSSTFPTKTSTTITGDSKPVIGSIVPSNSVPLSTPFFKQPTSTATTAPVFTGLATTTSTVASVTTTSSSTESASKPIFGFGVNGVASSSVSTSNLIPFGAAPASVSGLPKNENSEFNFQQPLPVSTLAAVTSFGQPLCSVTLMTSSSSSNTCTTTTITSCSGFPTSLPTTLAATTNQQYLTFPNITTPTFNLPFASSAKCTPQPYPGPNTQPAFGATQEQQQQATGPGFAPSSGNSFTFGNTLGPSAAPASAQTQLATSGSERIAFAGQKGTASALHTSASMQPTFGGTSTVSSFRIVASGFPAPTQTYTRTSSSTFGRSTPSPFTFGDSAAPAGSWNLGLDAATPGNSNNSGAFSFRARQSRISTPFGGGRLQPHLRNVLKPNQGFLGIQPFGSAAPSFAGGTGSKNPGPRQILQARRQHSRKK